VSGIGLLLSVENVLVLDSWPWWPGFQALKHVWHVQEGHLEAPLEAKRLHVADRICASTPPGTLQSTVMRSQACLHYSTLSTYLRTWH
jgi:hypothetical protein